MGTILSFGKSINQRSLASEIDFDAEMRKPVNWEKKDIEAWLRKDRSFSDVFIKIVVQRVKTGNELFSLKKKDLKKMKIKIQNNPIELNTAEIERLMNKIHKLKADPKSYVQLVKIPKPPTSNEQRKEATQMILKKLNAMKTNFSDEEKIKRGQNLIFKEKMLASYLSKEFVKQKNVIEELEEDEVSDDEEETLDEEEKQQKDQEEKMKEHELKMLAQQKLNLEGDRLSIKLVIVEIHNTNGQRLLRKALAPLINTFSMAPQFGIFHSALIVGPWYLEWNDSSLCIPRRCYSQAAVIAADLIQPYAAPVVEVALDRMSDIICDWNAKHTYDSKNYNCQTFVDTMCKALGIDISKQFPKDTTIGSFFEALRNNGRCTLDFKMNEQLIAITKPFIHEFQTKKNTIAFKTHREVDEFCHQVNRAAPQYFETELGQQDRFLLKSFDRAFWLRHYKKPNEETYKPHENECAFRNPNETGTMKKEFYRA